MGNGPKLTNTPDAPDQPKAQSMPNLSNAPSPPKSWEEVLSAQRLLQATFPDCVLVGGSASALHTKHRVSFDGDHVLSDLKDRYDKILHDLEHQAGWVTKRKTPPVQILGHFHGVEIGIRQLIRKRPLETLVVDRITIPTLAEMARIKGWLIVRRNTTRDFLDFVALCDKLQAEADGILPAIRELDSYYPQDAGESVLRQLCRQLSEPNPWDRDRIDLRMYKALKAPYADWSYIETRSKEIALLLMKDLLR